MENKQLASGTCWGRAKDTKEYRILFVSDFDEKLYDRVDYPGADPEVRKQLPPEPEAATSSELGEMSFQELKALPEYQQLPPTKNWRSKDELVQAIMGLRSSS